jgi:DNA-binding transcriptional MerR regulator
LDGETIRALASSTGRSYGFVRGVLIDNGITLRGRGGDQYGRKRRSAGEVPPVVSARDDGGVRDECLRAAAQVATAMDRRPHDASQMREAGISYRRLDYWTTRGYLKADQAKPGTGSKRTWSPVELAVARLMVRLVDDAGLNVEAAHRIARGTRELAPGITIIVADEPRPAPRAIRAKDMPGVVGEPGRNQVRDEIVTASRAEPSREHVESADGVPMILDLIDIL